MIPRSPRPVVVALLLALLAACAARPAAPVPQSPPPRPLVIHLPGVSGITSFDRRYVAVVRETMPDADIEMYDWTAGQPGMNALRAQARNRAQATQLAADLARRFRADPRLKVYLSGHSGGTAVAVWLLEQLPAEVKVQSVLLLASALSPEYDLTPALRHVDGHMYAFSSPGDRVVLGAGTALFGTMDGPRTQAAGLVGFTRPPSADPDQYAKLVQRPYEPAWLQYGNIGDHVGVLAVPFVRAVLMPLWITPQVAAMK